MSDDRPDPDALLARVQAQEERQRRGRLKIFFGAAPGVGKTYTMLEAGRKVAKEGVDVLVGYIEPHVRPETQALVLGLDMLARREVPYRGKMLLEFDLEAALARKPQLILVDELAHTNVPGVTHAKRWQDVEQLLEARIDVYSTLNVQHIETLNDVIAQITGVVVRETLPDSVFEKADEVELVDLAPDDLIDRLREGKVYLPDQARHAIDNFFRKGNLIALRELALRRMAERVDAQIEDYRVENVVSRIWPTSERLLVCVSPSPHAMRLVRTARRMAAGLRARWIAVHVETAADARMSSESRDRLAQTLHLAEQLGAETATLSGTSFADEVLHYARTRNVTKIVVGKPLQPRWREMLRGSYVYELTRRSGDIDIYVISGEQAADPSRKSLQPQATSSRMRYLGATGIVALCTGICALAFNYVQPSNLIMVYLLGVVATAIRLGSGPAALAAVLGVAAFDFCFIPPYFRFAVSDTEYLLTFAVMLFTGLVISTLTARVRFQADSARERERRTAALFGMSRELVDAATAVQVAQAAERHIAGAFDGQVYVLVPEEDSSGTKKLSAVAPGSQQPPLDDREIAVAQWVFEHGDPAGRGTDTLPAAKGLYLPLAAIPDSVGVLGFFAHDPERILTPDQLRLLKTFAGQLALAIDRVRASAEARSTQVQIETERLRNSLLSAVSHDLRTPLAAITGASSTLLESAGSLDAAMRRELAQSIYLEADRLNRLVANLLDMTRLDAGAIGIHKEWQPLEELIGVALGRLSTALEGREVIADLAADLPLVPVDGLLVGQVLLNLLDNAIKYSPKNAPIELSARRQDNAVVVEVADHGPGIPSADRERVFDKFFRSSLAPGRVGAGLGLTICRGIVALHGGRIWVDERPGGGSVFRFTLPLEGAPPKPVPVEMAAKETD